MDTQIKISNVKSNKIYQGAYKKIFAILNEDAIFCERYETDESVGYINGAKKELASEMGRSVGSMTYHQKHVLHILTKGEQGKPNYHSELPSVVNQILSERNMTISKMTYWFE